MKDSLEKEGLIPLDKSWIIRMGFLDTIDGRTGIIAFLDSQKGLSDDLLALRGVAKDWPDKQEVSVGESGTLYRFFKFASWKLGLNKRFILEGSLKSRTINDDRTIVDWPLEKLLGLDNGTSQWASAAVLMGNTDKLKNIPYKLQVTYDALEHWQEKNKAGLTWEPRYDETIENQVVCFLNILKGEKPVFIPQQAEDYCFARIFGFISKEEGEKRWPSLRGHESDRIEEVENTLEQLAHKKEVDSKDHRVVQAAALYQKLHELPIQIKYPNAVNKSWPQFWDFLEKVDVLVQ